MKRYFLLLTIITLIPMAFVSLVAKGDAQEPTRPMPAPSLDELNTAISKAQNYYDGLYIDLGKDGAVVAEYYPIIKYTVRHATIGGIYYYNYIGNATRAAQLEKLAVNYGFKKDNDHHSFIWKRQTNAPENIVYSSTVYRDCDTTLPSYKYIKPYRSKVCSLGGLGVNLFILSTKTDTFVPMINTLHKLQTGKLITSAEIRRYEEAFNKLGFGVPTCTPLSCTEAASTIRTAHFGEIMLRLNMLKYADTVAYHLLRAQDKTGAIYISYDKNGRHSTDKSVAYKALDLLLNDKEAYKGVIVTNAETMNDSLAFLLHYRCQRYGVGCSL